MLKLCLWYKSFSYWSVTTLKLSHGGVYSNKAKLMHCYKLEDNPCLTVLENGILERKPKPEGKSKKGEESQGWRPLFQGMTGTCQIHHPDISPREKEKVWWKRTRNIWRFGSVQRCVHSHCWRDWFSIRTKRQETDTETSKKKGKDNCTINVLYCWSVCLYFKSFKINENYSTKKIKKLRLVKNKK